MYLLDTNLVSEFRRLRSGRVEPAVVDWLQSIAPAAMFISAVTLHELEIGVRRLERRDPPAGGLLRQWLDQGVLPAFGPRVLPVDAAVAVRAAAYQVPDPAPIADALIAATAAVHHLTVATRNVRHFARFGDVAVVDPWAGDVTAAG